MENAQCRTPYWVRMIVKDGIITWTVNTELMSTAKGSVTDITHIAGRRGFQHIQDVKYDLCHMISVGRSVHVDETLHQCVKCMNEPSLHILIRFAG